jgi:methylisocitrate lyase
MGRAVERAVACVEAGADMIFPEAVLELAQYTEFRQAVGVPILANITEFGHTPLFTTPELGAAGVDIVLYCCGAYRAMNRGAETVYRALLDAGHQRDVIGIMQTRAELYDYLGYHEFERKLDELLAASADEAKEED